MHHLTRLLQIVIRSLIVGLASTLIVICSNGQSVTDGTTPAALTPGAPAGSYALSGFDNVNFYNGNMNFNLPLVSVAARGSVRVPVSLLFERHWRVEHTPNTNPNNPFYPFPIDYATYTQWFDQPNLGEPGTLSLRTMGHNISPCENPNEIWDPAANSETLTRLTFTTGDGTEYELIDDLTGGHVAANASCDFLDNYRYRGTVFRSTDGSGITYTADTQIVDDPWGNTDLPGGYLLFPDGTRYRIVGSVVTWIRDPNGNLTTFARTHNPDTLTIKDSINRQTFIEYNITDVSPYGLCDRIRWTGFGGASRSIHISKAPLSSLLRTTQPGDSSTTRTYYDLFPSLNGSSTATYFDLPDLISTVWLPNNQSYRFRYNVYGELARVELPTGGAIEYDHGAGVAADEPDGGVHFSSAVAEIYRRLLTRRVYKDGSTLEGQSTYSRPVIDQTAGQSDIARSHVDAVSTDPSGTVLAKSRHFFYGSALDSFYQSPNGLNSYYPNTWKAGKEFKTEILSTNGNDTVLRRIEHLFQQRVHIAWWPSNYPIEYEPANDPRPTVTTTTIEPGGPNLVTQQAFGYDDSVPYNNKNDTKEYDFGNGSPGSLVRETRTTYVTSSTYTGTSVYLRRLPSQTSIYDSSGIEKLRTSYEYDNYAADTNHAGQTPRSSISGLCAVVASPTQCDNSNPTAVTTRGNATATTHYLLNSTGSVMGSMSGYAQYDVAGNVVKAIDGRGYATTMDYSDRFGAPGAEARANSGSTELNNAGQYSYAFPTLVTNALGHTAYAQFDYYTGRPVNGEDANGIVSSGYSENEPLDRPTKVIRAANQDPSVQSQTTFSYDDVNHIITTTSDQTNWNDNVLKSQTLYDGLGRTTEKRSYEGGTNYIAVQQQYDALARAYKTSSPFRPWNGETALWTTSGFDALGRVISITTPDSAVMTTSYNGNSVTVTDQHDTAPGKSRKSVSDALGRMTQVYEDPGSLNYLTSYEYDVLDDLTTVSQYDPVSQHTQTRNFIYDSLKRLVSATNPENGATNYQYDDNGNLLVKTDARPVSNHYSYDALNRPLRRWYNGSNLVSAINNDPNLPNNASATSEVAFVYDSLGLPTGAPSYSRGPST